MSDLYFGIDAAGNKHVHVNGKCYTNEELADALEQAQQENERLRAALEVAVDDARLYRIALERIAGGCGGYSKAQHIAREALQGGG